MKRIDFVVGGLFLISVLGCNYIDFKDPPQDQATPLGGQNEPLSYRQIRNEVFIGPNPQAPLCLGCHNSSTSKGGVDLSSYEGLMDSFVVEPGNPQKSRLWEVLVSGEMPPGKNSATDDMMDMISNWISQGAIKEPS